MVFPPPVVQRRHYIMALKRSAYLKRGANYTPAATLLRCVRPDQSSATVRCHYLTDGGVNFAFTMRRAEYFIPVGILLKCFVEVSPVRACRKHHLACRKQVLLAGRLQQVQVVMIGACSQLPDWHIPLVNPLASRNTLQYRNKAPACTTVVSNHCGSTAALTWGLAGGQITHTYPGLKQACSAFLLACVGPRRHGHTNGTTSIQHPPTCIPR